MLLQHESEVSFHSSASYSSRLTITFTSHSNICLLSSAFTTLGDSSEVHFLTKHSTRVLFCSIRSARRFRHFHCSLNLLISQHTARIIQLSCLSLIHNKNLNFCFHSSTRKAANETFSFIRYHIGEFSFFVFLVLIFPPKKKLFLGHTLELKGEFTFVSC